jgi:hypothetical protein
MLGLMSALARRERQRVAQALDAAIATTLRPHSRAHQRQESLRLLALQSEAFPALVAQIQGLVAQMQAQGPALATQMERQGLALQEGLLASQAGFQREAQRAYGALADSVDRSLRASLTESARLAGAAIEPAVQATLAGLARQATAVQDALHATAQGQIEGVVAHLQATTSALMDGAATRQETLTQHAGAALATAVAGFETHASALLRSVAQAHDDLDAAAATREHQRMGVLHESLADMAATLHREGLQAGAAMAEVIGELRLAVGAGQARDNAALDERNRLIGQLAGLLDAVSLASTEQRGALDGLVRATADVLGRAGAGFAETVQAGSRTLQDAAVQVTVGAAEVASLGEGFGLAVQLFSRASEQLSAQLQRIETALGQSMARSDQQLAYYVAQAREIIDLTLGSHKQIVDDLQQINRTPLSVAPAGAATAVA